MNRKSYELWFNKKEYELTDIPVVGAGFTGARPPVDIRAIFFVRTISLVPI